MSDEPVLPNVTIKVEPAEEEGKFTATATYSRPDGEDQVLATTTTGHPTSAYSGASAAAAAIFQRRAASTASREHLQRALRSAFGKSDGEATSS